jgi:uncharacterized protein (DUF1800 family)
MSEQAIDERSKVIEQEPSIDATLAQSHLGSAAATAAALAAAAVLAACGGGGGEAGNSSGSSSGSTVTPDPQTAGRSVTVSTAGATQLTINPTTDDAKISRFLQQAKFGGTDADIAAVKSMGYAGWLQAEIAKPFTMGWDWLNRQGYSDVSSSDNVYADYMVWSQLMSANDGLRKRAALALSEVVVVSLNGLDFNWRSHAVTHYWDTICTHALGNYRQLLEAITLNVAMGYYLNTKGNRYRSTSQPDENFAREIMQLFTIGLVELNIDGTPKQVSGVNVDTYSADDIKALAHMFTGWDLDTSKGTNSADFTRLPLRLTASNHSPEGKTIFGVKPAGFTPKPLVISAGTDGRTALTQVLDYLFNHDNTAPFVSKQLIQRLVTSNPSTTYVRDVATVFKNTNGDLAHVFAAILLHDEARTVPGAGQTESGKLREPIARVIQWGRTFGVSSTTGQWKVGNLTEGFDKFLGQSPLRSASVFNFFRPGYVPPSTSLTAGVVAPEFQVVNESTVGGYLNFMMQAIKDGVSGSSDMKAAYTEELKWVASPSLANPKALVQRLNRLLCAGQLSSATEDLITAAAGKMSPTTGTPNRDQARNRVCAAVLMVMACPEYLIQK